MSFARKHYPRTRVVLDVAAFNRRALAVYTRVSFIETGRRTERFEGYGDVEFVEMELLDTEMSG
ncbi:hypothetical protein [Parafrankia irregularis]|uniref:hypothetical protein n=1 Tax=Parafrankia irregularis TaxID=795642 RepID=UPI0030FE5FF4